MRTWLSIDCDFFYDGPDDTTCAPAKRRWLHPASLVEGVRSLPGEIHLGMDHHELLARWDAAGIRGVRCLHFDAHHDVFVDYNRAWELPMGTRGARVGVGDHLFHALREGIVAELTWVLPSWLSVAAARQELRARLGSHLAAAVDPRPFEAGWCEEPTVHGAFVCLSPEWTPRRDLTDFVVMVRSLGATELEVETWCAAAEGRYDSLARGLDPLTLRFCFGARAARSKL
jgi:hypothetical protein